MQSLRFKQTRSFSSSSARSCARKAGPLPPVQHTRRPRTFCFAAHDPSVEEFVEVKVESVRASQGTSILYLRVCESANLVIPVHIGESESTALLKEINKQRQMRPATHDVSKNMLQAVGFEVKKVRITDIIANTYYARIHLGKATAADGTASADEVDIDARPSDAINLAVRFNAPIYVARKIAANAAPLMPLETASSSSSSSGESHSEIARSVRETLAHYEDPTIMYQLQKELAIKQERFQDAHMFQQHIVHEMTHNRLLQLVVAMESALADGRYEEASRLRDDYRQLVAQAAAVGARTSDASTSWAT